MSTQGTQFQPDYKLTLFRASGEGIEINPPACIIFDIQLDRIAQPNEATITLFNLNDTQISAIENTEFSLVRLEAGYERANNVAVIFEGGIRHSSVRARDGNDFLTTIVAAEGELAWRRSTINRRFEAGQTLPQIVRAALADIPRISEGNLTGIEGFQPLSGAWIVSGSLRAFYNEIATTTNSRWSVQRNSLDFVSNEQSGDTFIVSKKTFNTGLVDAQLDESGVEAEFALDPALRPNGIVEIESGRPQTSGFWRIDSVRHVGEYGGQGEWATFITGQRRTNIARVSRQEERTTFRA